MSSTVSLIKQQRQQQLQLQLQHQVMLQTHRVLQQQQQATATQTSTSASLTAATLTTATLTAATGSASSTSTTPPAASNAAAVSSTPLANGNAHSYSEQYQKRKNPDLNNPTTEPSTDASASSSLDGRLSSSSSSSISGSANRSNAINPNSSPILSSASSTKELQDPPKRRKFDPPIENQKPPTDVKTTAEKKPVSDPNLAARQRQKTEEQVKIQKTQYSTNSKIAKLNQYSDLKTLQEIYSDVTTNQNVLRVRDLTLLLNRLSKLKIKAPKDLFEFTVNTFFKMMTTDVEFTGQATSTTIQALGMIKNIQDYNINIQKLHENVLILLNKLPAQIQKEKREQSHNLIPELVISTTMSGLSRLSETTGLVLDKKQDSDTIIALLNELGSNKPNEIDISSTLENLGFLVKDSGLYLDGTRLANEIFILLKIFKNKHPNTADISNAFFGLGHITEFCLLNITKELSEFISSFIRRFMDKSPNALDISKMVFGLSKIVEHSQFRMDKEDLSEMISDLSDDLYRHTTPNYNEIIRILHAFVKLVQTHDLVFEGSFFNKSIKFLINQFLTSKIMKPEGMISFLEDITVLIKSKKFECSDNLIHEIVNTFKNKIDNNTATVAEQLQFHNNTTLLLGCIPKPAPKPITPAFSAAITAASATAARPLPAASAVLGTSALSASCSSQQPKPSEKDLKDLIEIDEISETEISLDPTQKKK